MFDILEKELELDHAFIENACDRFIYESYSDLSHEVYMESASSTGLQVRGAQKKPESALKKLITRVIDTLKGMVGKVKKTVTETSANKSIKQAEEEIKKEPKKKNRKINRKKEWKKLQEVNDNYMHLVMHSENELELKAKMEKYRKERNAILKGSIVASIGAGAAIVYLKNLKDNGIGKLEKQVQEVEENFHRMEMKYNKSRNLLYSYKKKNTDLRHQNSDLKDRLSIVNASSMGDRVNAVKEMAINKVSRKQDEMTGTIERAKEMVSAVCEIMANATKDMADNAKELVEGIQGAKTPIGVAKTMKKVTADIKDSAVNNFKPSAIAGAIENRLDASTKEGKRILENIKKAQVAMSKHPEGSEGYKRAKEYLKKAQRQYNINGFISATIDKRL